MDNIILALGINPNTNKTEQISVGTMPWNGIKIVDLKMLDPNLVEFSNAYIGFDGNLVNKGIELSHYTKYNILNGQLIQRSYHILLQSKSQNGKIYFVTDGISNPCWLTLNEIYNQVLNGYVRLANAKIVHRDGVRYISAVKGDIKEVDYVQTQLEYRQYLKSIRKE